MIEPQALTQTRTGTVTATGTVTVSDRLRRSLVTVPGPACHCIHPSRGAERLQRERERAPAPAGVLRPATRARAQAASQ
jgi:hypothetical protein